MARALSKRFIPVALHEPLGKLCAILRTDAAKQGNTLTDSELAALAAIVAQTGVRPGAITADVVAGALQKRLAALYYDAGTQRTWIPTGFRAPELEDRGDDMIQAALWVMDDLEEQAPRRQALALTAEK